MAEVGFILLHRKLFDSGDFRNDAERMFFMWLVAKAAWQPTAAQYDGRRYQLERGQLVVSEREAAEAWDWGRQKVRGLFSRLEAAERMTRNFDQHGTQRAPVISICNYDTYQAQPKAGNPIDDPAATQGQPKGNPAYIDNNRNKGNKYSGAYAPDAFASPAEALTAVQLQEDPSPKDRIWGPMREWLVQRTGKPDGKIRSWLGKLTRDHGDGAVLEAAQAAWSASPHDPIPYIEKVLLGKTRAPPSAAPFNIAHEYERRANDERESSAGYSDAADFLRIESAANVERW